MPAITLPKRFFLISSFLLCLAYFLFELFFNSHIMLTVDEFYFSHAAYRYQTQIPYRDFAPYKTVLGYYLLLLPMYFSQGIFSTLLTIKNCIAATNALILLLAACSIARFFSYRATLIALAIACCTPLFLSFSTNIRVDLFAYWFCLFSLLALLNQRFWLAGCLIGLGFMTSQKATWYLIASDMALGLSWLTFSRQRKSLWPLLQFNLSASICILIYLATWSYVSNWHTVYENVFGEARAMYQLVWYQSFRLYFWSTALVENGLFFLLSPLALLSLIIPQKIDMTYQRRFFVIIYAAVIGICLLNYQQIFIYNMLAALPALLVLYAAFFQWLISLYHQPLTDHLTVWQQGLLYAFCIIYLATLFSLSYFSIITLPYPLLFLLPFVIFYFAKSQHRLSAAHKTVCTAFINIMILFLASFYPLTIYIPELILNNNAYQQANLYVAQALLQDGTSYVAGTDLFFDRQQSISGLRNLVGPTIAYLKSPSAELRAVMLPSLDQDPDATPASIIASLDKKPIKFYVNNYRIKALPDEITYYLQTHYQHFWGSIYLYAPQVGPGETTLFIAFNGQYKIETGIANRVRLNGHDYPAGSVVTLKAGKYSSNALEGYRLTLQPSGLASMLNPAFTEDNWTRIIY